MRGETYVGVDIVRIAVEEGGRRKDGVAKSDGRCLMD